MIILPFLHFFSFLACFFLAVFVFYKDPRSILNRMCSIIMLCYALWNFGDIILHNPDRTISIGTVQIMQNIASFGWISFASALLCFSLVFAKKENLLKRKWFLFIIIILPFLFLYKQFTNCLTINPLRQPYGWSVDWANTIWSYLFFAYYMIFTLLSVLVIYLYGKTTKIFNEKKQAKIIVITVSVGIFAGTLLDVVIQLLGFSNIPPMTNLMVFVFASGVIYAMFKYRFLTITPTIAAENIISAMDEFLILLNQEGIILNANKATLDSLQYKEIELVGNPISMLSQENSFKTELFERITKKETVSNHDTNFIAKNGKIIPVIYSISPVSDNSGIVIGTVFIARDITSHKQIENELIESKEKAEESDRLKSAFLANMSHEIRTPMNGILGFASLLREPELNGEKQQEYIQIIEKSGARMLNIINDIIDISKIEAGMVDVVMNESNINEQIEYIYTFFKPEAEAKGLKLSFKNALPAKAAIIITDREKVFAILTNLIKNAIKYSTEGSIEFGYHVNVEEPTSYLQFFVKDTGIGIPANRQEAIFERFIQADVTDKMAHQGAGLGLSITKAYVEILNGKIWVESEVGNGSTFYFSLPYGTIPQEKNRFKDIETYRNEYNTFEKLKILIAEDDDTSRKLICYSLKDLCKEIIETKTGIETVEVCRKKHDIDLILMDIQMPDTNGYEATQQIRQFNRDIKIIAQTAYAQTDDKSKAIDAGCDDYISKPIKKDELIALIRKHFN